MKNKSYLLLLFLIFSACGSADRKKEGLTPADLPEPSLWEEQDLSRLQTIYQELGDDQGMPVAALVEKTGLLFLETPYVAHTLEKEPEQLVINLHGLDCTTFGENCLALARTLHAGELTADAFASQLELIRYRGGILDGYPSRLHYFCDWIHDNARKGLIRDCTRELGGIPLDKEINFMSTHPDAYVQLEKDSGLVEAIRRQEEIITARGLFYLPEQSVEGAEPALQEGDLVGITTSIGGIAVMHVGILVRRDERIHLLHASSAAGKVVVSEEPLSVYLQNNGKATGIMVARPL